MSFITYRPIILGFEDPLARKLVHSDGIIEETSKGANRSIIKEKEFNITLDVPGVKLNDLELKIDEGVLRITGVRQTFVSEGKAVKKSRIDHSFAIDADIDVSKMKANLSDGVLVVTAPKIPKPEPIVVKISTLPHEKFLQVSEKGSDKDKNSEKSDLSKINEKQ